MALPQLAFAFTVPRLTARFGNAALVTTGLAVTLVGMAWLSRISGASDYWTAVAAPMLLLGAGREIGFAPLTAASFAAVRPRDSGASDLGNVAHQLGGALRVSIMVTVAATAAVESTPEATVTEASADLTTGAILLAIGLLPPRH